MKKTKEKRTCSTEARPDAERRILAFKAGRPKRPGLKHGIGSLLKTGEIPAEIQGAKQITDEVNLVISQMIEDLGGSSEITAQVQTILEAQRLCLLVLKLSGRYLNSEGLINKRTKRPHALLGVAVSFINAARLNSLALGLGRRSRKVGPTTLTEYLDTRSAVVPDGATPAVEQ